MSYFSNQNLRERVQFVPGRWVAADLHIHSSYSGGSLTPAELLVMAGMQLLEIIGFADHGQVEGVFEGERMAETNPGFPLVISTQEISLGDHFHLLAVGSRESFGGDNRKQLLEKLTSHHEHGGAVILGHPWTVPKTGWAADCLRELLDGSMIDGIELFNASLLDLPRGESLLRPVWEEIILPYRLGITGGSDFHYHRQGGRRLGTGRTYLKVNIPGVSGIIEALRERRTVAGMFSYRPFDLGCFGSGYHVLLGNDPWSGQLNGMIAALRQRIDRLSKLNPEKRKALNRLTAWGYYQLAADLAEG